jgi:hypothetical protein
MRPYMQHLMGNDSLGAKTICFQFCEEQGLPPLAVTAATMARYIARIGERCTIKATSLQPYLSAVSGFFKDHGAEQSHMAT